ncbi:MAG: endonuclease domain-containing protein [Panacagrimonas sp.]
MSRRASIPSPPGRGCPEGAGEGESKWKHALPLETLTRARQLRATMTDAENLMWHLLRDRRFGGLKFRRQHPLPPCVLDFYCQALKLGVELDGGQHNEDSAQCRDLARSRVLQDHGIHVIRYWNHDVLMRTEEVLSDLWDRVQALSDSPSPAPPGHPLPRGEGKGVRHV